MLSILHGGLIRRGCAAVAVAVAVAIAVAVREGALLRGLRGLILVLVLVVVVGLRLSDLRDGLRDVARAKEAAAAASSARLRRLRSG